MTDLSSNF